MSKKQLVQTLNYELKKVNEKIDYKIVQGLPYQREARRHRRIIGQLRQVTQIPTMLSFWG